MRSTGQWAAGKVVGALNATKLASDIAVKSSICKPMVESEAATRCGWVKGLFVSNAPRSCARGCVCPCALGFALSTYSTLLITLYLLTCIFGRFITLIRSYLSAFYLTFLWLKYSTAIFVYTLLYLRIVCRSVGKRETGVCETPRAPAE